MTNLTSKQFFRGGNDRLRQATKRTRTDSDASPATSNNQLKINTNTENENVAEFLTVKLERLQDKYDRYDSHISFLTKCVKEKVIPNGLRIDLEPSIGNHDDDFLTKWYERLQSFSVTLMEDVIEFCKKTNENITQQINTVENNLTDKIEEQNLREIKTIMKKNQESRRKTLDQKKQRKFTRFKYHPETRLEKPTVKEKTTYSNAVKRKRSNTRVTPRNSNHRLAVPQQETTTSAQGQKNKDIINELQNEIKMLKEQRNATTPKTTQSSTSTKTQQMIPRPPQTPSKNGRTLTFNTEGERLSEIQQMINLIHTSMQTLGEFEKRLKAQQNTNPIPSDQ